MSESAKGVADMMHFTDRFPDQLLEGMERAKGSPFPVSDARLVLTVGMGGSAIAGDLIASLATSIGAVPVVPVRSFELPRWVGKDTPVILESYSGDTVETLAAYDAARSLGVPRAVVTSGGALLERARQDGVAAVQLPPGVPQRASLGYQFGALYGLLYPSFPEGEQPLVRGVQNLREMAPSFKAPGNLPFLVVEAWKERKLWVLVPEPLAPVGKRWMTQAAENAKQLVRFDTIPESMHNAIVGWDHLPDSEAGAHYVVLLSGPASGAFVQERMEYLSRLLRRKRVDHLSLRLRSTDPLTELLEAVWIGDYVSILKAQAAGENPMVVGAIDQMKAALKPV